MITGASQAYPEIMFDYVIGEDNTSDSAFFINLIKNALSKYENAWKMKPSHQSMNALQNLKHIVNSRDSEKLINAVNYYMSIRVHNTTFAGTYGSPLKPESHLYKSLQKALIESGAYQDY